MVYKYTPVAEANLGAEIYEALLGDILATRLSGGTVIQQRRLAIDYAVSRSPMRHALSRLEGEGLLVRDETGSLVVRTVTLRDYLHSLDMRVLLEPAAAAAACLAPGSGVLADLRSQFAALAADPAPDLQTVWAFDDALHGYIAERSGNSFMAATITDMRRYTTIFERQMPVVRAKPGMAEHSALLSALENKDASAARQAMSVHLDVVREGVLQNY